MAIKTKTYTAEFTGYFDVDVDIPLLVEDYYERLGYESPEEAAEAYENGEIDEWDIDKIIEEELGGAYIETYTNDTIGPEIDADFIEIAYVGCNQDRLEFEFVEER